MSPKIARKDMFAYFDNVILFIFKVIINNASDCLTIMLNEETKLLQSISALTTQIKKNAVSLRRSSGNNFGN